MTETATGARRPESVAQGGWTPPPPGAERPPLVAPPAALPRARRRPGMLGLGAALVAAGALTAVWLVAGAGQRVPVLALARDVPFGAVLSDADLTTARVAVDPAVPTVPAAERPRVVGRVAASGVPAGSLLTPAALSAAAPPGAGEQLVAVAVPAARMPAGGLQGGDRVLVVDTPAADGDPPSTPPATIAASVVRVGSADANGASVVDVTVAAGDGPALAARAATGRIALVVQPHAGEAGTP